MIETKRLCLSELTQNDFDKISPMLKNIEVMYAWEHGFCDEEIKAWIDRRIEGYKKHGYDYFLATDKETGEVVGQIGILNSDIGIAVGYILDKPFWHKGYANEGVKACIDYAFNVLGAEKVVCDIRPQNKASIAVALKLGFTKVGEIVKHYNGIDMPHLVYEKEKIKLRPLEKGDVNNLFFLTSNKNVAKFMRFDTHESIEEAENLLCEYLDETSFAIEIADKFAGVFVLKEDVENSFSMSIFLDEPYWNSGYATKILQKIIVFAKNDLKAESLKAYVVYENEGSKKVLVNNGFYEDEILKFPDLPNGLIVFKLIL